MGILLVLLITLLAIGRPSAIGEWSSGFDPKTYPGLVLVVLAGFFSEYLTLKALAGRKNLGMSSALRWFGTNGLAAAIWALPVSVLLHTNLLDPLRVHWIAVGVVLAEFILVALTTGYLWSRSRGTSLARGVRTFGLVNLVSIASVVGTGFVWHYLYDWLEAMGVVDFVFEKTRSAPR